MDVVDVDLFEKSVNKFVAFRNVFSSSAYQYVSENIQRNCVISPFIAECVLTLMQLGAKGQTKEEIGEKLFHLPCAESSITMALHFIFTILTTENFHRLGLATKIFVNHGYVIKHEFRHIAEYYCKARIENMDFTELCAHAMNEFAKKRIPILSHIKITNMLSLDPKIILFNYVNFKGRWQLPFSKKNTPMQFFENKQKSIMVESMTNKGFHKYYYLDDLKTKILDIRFETQREEASLVLIIPDAIEDLPLVEKNITSVFNLNCKLFQQTFIELELPIFKTESFVGFKEIFNRSGIQMIFNEDEADLTGMSYRKGLCLNHFAQNVVFDLNEEGINVDDSLPNSGDFFEDLVSTTFSDSVSADSHHPYVKADRPFAFYIKMRNVIVMIGRILNPFS